MKFINRYWYFINLRQYNKIALGSVLKRHWVFLLWFFSKTACWKPFLQIAIFSKTARLNAHFCYFWQFRNHKNLTATRNVSFNSLQESLFFQNDWLYNAPYFRKNKWSTSYSRWNSLHWCISFVVIALRTSEVSFPTLKDTTDSLSPKGIKYWKKSKISERIKSR